MEQLIKALDELNTKLKKVNKTLGAIMEDLRIVLPPNQSIFGDEQDIKNTDSNADRED